MTTQPTVSESTEGLETQRSEQKPMTRERETIARIIDPKGWDTFERQTKCAAELYADDPRNMAAAEKQSAMYVAESLSKADQILALGPGEGWRLVNDPQTPHACHVIAARFMEDCGDWALAVVLSPPSYPFTHWVDLSVLPTMPLPSPPIPNGEENQGLSPSRDLGPASAAQDADMWKPCTGCGAEPLQLHREGCPVMLANRP